MADIGSLNVRITGDAAQLSRVLNGISRKSKNTSDQIQKSVGGGATSAFTKLGKTVGKAAAVLGPMAAAAGVATAGIAALGGAAAKAAKQTFDWFSTMSKGTQELSRNARAAGIGVEEYQALSATFQRFNADASDLQDVLGTIADRAQDAAAGAVGPKEDFELLGIAVDDLRGKDPAGLLNEVANGLQAVDDPSKRMAAAARILGDDLARKLVPLLSEGEEGLRKFKEEAREAGQVLSKETVAGALAFTETLERLQRAIEGVKKTVFTVLVPTMNLIIETVETAANLFGDFEVSIEFVQRVLFGFTKRAMLTAIDAILEMNTAFAGVIKGLSFFNEAIKGSARLIVAFGQGFEAIKAAVFAAKDLIVGFATDILGGLIDRLVESVKFLRELAESAGLDGLAGALKTAEDAGRNFGDSVDDFSSDQMKKARKGFEDAKKEADLISAALEVDLRTSLDDMIERLGNTNDGLRKRLEALRARLEARQFQRAQPRDQGGGGGGGGAAPSDEEPAGQEAIPIAERLSALWGAIRDKAQEWKDSITSWVSSDGEETEEQSDDILQSWKNVVGAVGQVGSAMSRLPGVSDKVGIAVEGITGAMITVLGTIQAAIAASTTLGATLAAATGGLTLIAGIIGTVASLAANKKGKGSSERKQEEDRVAEKFAKAYADEIERRDLMTTNVFVDSGSQNRMEPQRMSSTDLRDLNDRLARIATLDQ